MSAALSVAQGTPPQTPPQNPPQNPQQGPQQQGNQQGNPQNQQQNNPNNPNNPNNTQNKNQKPPPPTPLEKALAELDKIKKKDAQASKLTIGPIIVLPATVGDTVTFKTNVYDHTATANVQSLYLFALTGAPYGAYVDPNTGDFTWVAQTWGMFTFYVWVEDQNDTTRVANQQVTITVSPPLPTFGYGIFAKARAVIDTRMLLIKSGLLQGVNSVANLQTSPQAMPLSQQNPANLLAPQSSTNIFIPSSINASPQNSLVPQPFVPPVSPFNNNQGQGLGQNNGNNPGSQFNSGGQNSYLNNGVQNMLNGLGQYGTLNNMQNGAGSFQGMGQSPFQNANPSTFSPFTPYGQLGQSFGPYGQQAGQLGGAQLGGQSPLGGLQQGQSFGGGQQGQYNPGQMGFPGQGTYPGLQGYPGLQQGNLYGSQPIQGQVNLGSGGVYPIPNLPNGVMPFSSSSPNGLNIQPSPVFTNLQSLLYSSQNPQTGLPGQNMGNAVDALKYLVGPLEEMGNNVYLPYPERYQLGAGDLLTARIWSPTLQSQDYDLKVDEIGRLLLPGDNQKLSVRGLTLGETQELLKKRIKALFKNGQITLSLKALRTMSVQIMGNAYMPGNYHVPAVATLFNTLMICGGPADDGSLRKITLTRTDKTVKTFDLYKYLTNGDTSADVPLQPGDIIFIPPASTRVSVKGEVLHPAVYETMPADKLKDVIGFAGGAKATGVTQRVEVDTEEPGTGRAQRDVDMAKTDTPVKFFDGDTVTVFSVRDDVINELKLDGAVDQPGTYEFRKGMTFADLITRARGLRPDAYTIRADLFRRNPDKTETIIPVDLQRALARDPQANLALVVHDRVEVYHLDDVKWKGDRKVTIAGSVQKPGDYDRQDGEKLADLLLQAGGVTPDAFLNLAIVQRTNLDGTTGPLFRINLLKLAVADASQNILLQDHDVVTIQSMKDANFIPDQSVDISGAVQKPGNYQRGANMRVRDLIQEAGNLMPNHGTYVEIKHARVPETTPPLRIRVADIIGDSPDPNANVLLADNDLVTIQSDSSIELLPKKVIVVGDGIAKPGTYSITSSDRLSDVIERAGGVRLHGFVDGAQFYRDPNQLVSDTQHNLSIPIIQMLEVVAQDEYTRALALSDVEKIRVIKDIGTGASIPLLGSLGATATQPANNTPIPQSLLDEKTVTMARDITNNLTPTGNLNIRMRNALKHKGGLDDILLRDGDIIDVPLVPSTITVVGAVAIPSAVQFEPGRTVGFYVDRAGGYVTDAAKDRMIIIRAGGLVQKVNRGVRVELGDQILVPSKVMAAKFSDRAEEIDAVGKLITGGAVIIALLRTIL